MDIVFLIGRIIFGAIFVMFGINHFKHKSSMVGYAKSMNLPKPESSVFFSGLLLVLSGALLILGIFPDVALTLLAVFLIAVSFTMHKFWKDTDPNQKMSNMVNFMKNMALFGACLMLLWLRHWPISF